MNAFRCGNRVEKIIGVGAGATGYVQKIELTGSLTGALRVEWDDVPGEMPGELTFPEAVRRIARPKYRHVPSNWQEFPDELRRALCKSGVPA